LKLFLEEKESSLLKAWFKHFDHNVNGRVSFSEFKSGMQKCEFPGGNAEGLWTELDPEESGEITLNEICDEQAQLWNSFKRWCGANFDGARGMISKLKEASAPYVQPNITHARFSITAMEEMLQPSEWKMGLRQCGWDGGSEDLLFHAIDIEVEGILAARELRWLESEVHRHRVKENARLVATRESMRKSAARQWAQMMLKNFKAFLARGFGPTYHAWRRVLDPDGSMTLPRATLFKICRNLNWKGDVRALWRALDFDNSGSTTLEELDPHCAQLLAQFKDWAERTFGPKPAVAMWKELSKRRLRKLTYLQFAQECQVRGFERKLKTLAAWLDWHGKKYIEEDDLRFLDGWRTPPWLVAQPNPEAAEQFRRHLKHKYGHYLRAWRTVMDRDGSNCCNWHEFVDAAKQMKFHGDVAGAWLAMDDDLSGFVSIKEIDEPTHNALAEFKTWATEEFGGVGVAFKVLDKDHSSELTYKEFRFAVRSYGFTGDLQKLFETLDQDRTGCLQGKELAFLDRWNVQGQELDGRVVEGEEAEQDVDTLADQAADRSSLPDYITLGPGPGAYDVQSTFAPVSSSPGARHGGAFSFTGRRKLGWLRVAKSVGPAYYDLTPVVAATQEKRKPSWSFGSQNRSVMTPREETASPGPGAYEARTSFHGPKFTLGNRRGVSMHPLQRASLTQRSDRSQAYRR